MKRLIGSATAALALVLIVSSAAEARRAVHDPSPVWELPGVMQEVDGAAASITRSNGGVTVTFDSSGFGPHHAVTLWSISFDHPENCTKGGPLPDGRIALCGPGDNTGQAAIDTGFGVQPLAGHVIGANGNANYAGHVQVANPFGAEFHIVIADHGPKDPAELPGQIMSPDVGSQIAFFVP